MRTAKGNTTYARDDYSNRLTKQNRAMIYLVTFVGEGAMILVADLSLTPVKVQQQWPLYGAGMCHPAKQALRPAL